MLCGLAHSEARAEKRFVNGGWSGPPQRPGGIHGGRHGHRGLFVPFFWDNREVVVVEREIIREVPAAPPPPPEPPPPPRKPYVIGSTYASLPTGCMKLIEDGASYYYCGGEWYEQLGKQYKAVSR